LAVIIQPVPLTDLPQTRALPQRTAALLAAGLIAMLAITGCSGGAKHGVVQVELRVTVSPKGSNTSIGLPVPDADVTVRTGAGHEVAAGKTDRAGSASFKVDQFGPVQVVVRSPLLKGGEATSSGNLSPDGGYSALFQVPMSPDVTTDQPWTSGR
jgi:hypothetical protein